MEKETAVPSNAEHGYFIMTRRREERIARGELHPQSKLTPELVRLIRKDTRSNYAVGLQLGVTGACISNVRRGLSYAWVKDEEDESPSLGEGMDA